jgi:type II secretory pathway component PulK
MEPTPLAVSMSALVNLMQFVVIALLLVYVAMMVTLQLAKARTHRRRSAAERGRRRSFWIARNGPQGQGKKIGDNLCGRDDSCDQHVMQSNTSGEVRWPRLETG